MTQVSNIGVKKKKLVKLEAIRGMSAIYVIFHHIFTKSYYVAGKDLSIIFHFGAEAVILFFLMSGFVIQYAYLISPDKTFRSFIIKRLPRIYIPLVLVFIANYFVVSIERNSFGRIDFWTLGGNLFMLQDLSALKPNVICDPFLGNSPLWSLSYEWWFYLIFFFLITKFKEKSSLVAYALSILAAISYIFIPNFFNREIMYLMIWWVGADLARLYVKKGVFSFQDLSVPLLSLVINIFILYINIKVHNGTIVLRPLSKIGASPFLEWRHFSFALLAVVGALSWKRINWLGFNYTIGLFEFVAPISFGLYISHWFLLTEAHYLDGVLQNQLLRYGCYIFVCVGFSYIIERVIYRAANRKILSSFLSKSEKI